MLPLIVIIIMKDFVQQLFRALAVGIAIYAVFLAIYLFLGRPVSLNRELGVDYFLLRSSCSWEDFHCATWIHFDRVAKKEIVWSLVVEFKEVFSWIRLRIGKSSAGSSVRDKIGVPTLRRSCATSSMS